MSALQAADLEPPRRDVSQADELQACLGRARSLCEQSESSALDCGRALLRAKEICVREGRKWYAELERAGIPKRTAARYLKKLQQESPIGQLADTGQSESEESTPPPCCTTADLASLITAGRTFGAIYADPPWQYGNQSTRAAWRPA